MEFVGVMFFVLTIIAIIVTGNDFAPILIGLTLSALIYIGGTVSGAHYNPAVTLGLWARRKISLNDGIGYVLAQLLGAVIAYIVATKLLGFNLRPVGYDSDMVAVFIAEFLFTFALVTAVFHTAVSHATAGNSYYGFAIGGVVIAGAAAVGGISGGFFNPAVLLGVGLGGISATAVITILVAHIAAAFAAAYFYQFTTGKN